MKPSDPEFELLVDRVRTGDPDAKRELLDRYSDLVRNAVRRQLPGRLRREFDSMDFAQDVWRSFFALPAERTEFSNPGALANFLAQIARHKVVDAIRRRKTLARDIDREQAMHGSTVSASVGDCPCDAPTPSQEAIAKECAENLVASLPEKYQNLVKLLQEGRTYADTAERLGVTTRTVERLVQKLKDLRDR